MSRIFKNLVSKMGTHCTLLNGQQMRLPLAQVRPILEPGLQDSRVIGRLTSQ